MGWSCMLTMYNLPAIMKFRASASLRHARPRAVLVPGLFKDMAEALHGFFRRQETPDALWRRQRDVS